MAQGKYKINGDFKHYIPEYDMSGGSTEWILPMTATYKWMFFFQIESIAGSGGTLQVMCSGDEGNSWVDYPGLTSKAVSSNTSISFDDSYTVYDYIKVVFTAGSITGGTMTINQRLYSNPIK